MKKITSLVLAFVLFVLISTPVFSAVSAPANTVLDNATGKIGLLYVGTLTQEAKSFIANYKANSKNYEVSFDNNFISFIRWERSLKDLISVYSTEIHFKTTVSGSVVSFDINSGVPRSADVGVISVTSGSFTNSNLVGYGPYLSAGYSMSSYEKIWTPVKNSPTGNYWVTFDNGTGAEDEDEKGFWEKLGDFFKWIFVPEDGYFDDWFNEIRTAFTAKLGGIGTLFDTLSSSFEALQNGTAGKSNLILSIPKDYIYKGFGGSTVNLLSKDLTVMFNWIRNTITAIIIVITAIVCFKKVIALTKA